MPLTLPPEIDRLFSAGGSMGRSMRNLDWHRTDMGPPDRWPQSLRTAVSVCLESRFPLLIWWGPELVMLYNDAYAEIIGSKHPAALGMRGRDCWPEIWDTIGPMLSAVLEGRGATYSEDQLLPLVRHGFAEECYFTFSYSPIRNEAGGIGGVFTAVTETTGRVLGARRLATLRSLAQQAAGAASVADVFAEASDVLAAATADIPLAVLLDEGDGGPVRLAVPGSLPELELARITAAAAGAPLPLAAAGESVELAEPMPSTGVRRLLVLPIEVPSGLSARLVLGLSPSLRLTGDYRSFLALVAGQLATSLAEASGHETERARAEALAALDEAKTTFFTNISHEFRTPLTLILGPAEDALGDATEPLGPRQRPRAELVRRNALRLLKLVNALLDFARLQSGRVAARYEPVELGSYTAELAGMFQSAVAGAGLGFTVDCPQVEVPVFVDREMWEKIVLNLLSNALKSTFTGSITVRLRQDAQHVTLSVVDTGVGIEEADQSALFERFHRVPGAKSRSFEGSGIGLALVADLVALHGGQVSVTSTVGAGSTFEVRLPTGTEHLPPDRVIAEPALAATSSRDGSMQILAREFLEEAQRWTPPADTGSVAAPGGSAVRADDERPRILVVDDNADMRDYVTATLAPEFDVRAAGDGMAALQRVRIDPPDLVIADVMMPRLDGFGLLTALREEPDTAHIPVILLSARAGEDAAVEGLDAGADDYLAKPFAARELLARVRSALTLERMRRERGRDRRLLADLQQSRAMLDQAQRLAKVGSWEIDLSTGSIVASDEIVRQLDLSREDLARDGLEGVLSERVHPDDVAMVRTALAAGARGDPIDFDVRLQSPDGGYRTYHAIAEVQRDDEGRPVRLAGSTQDITDQREAEQAVVAVAAAREAAAREHRIVDALQRSLLPSELPTSAALEVAGCYRPASEGAQVGGDWYDVIDLPGGRMALVIGDVMGHGVPAAAVMGQLRAAIRALARIELPPADVLRLLDGVVCDLGEDQIVTCIYAVYDPARRSLISANAGHLPPVVVARGVRMRPVRAGEAPPLGTGAVDPREQTLRLPAGATVALYTDGLVERRHRDIDGGVDELGAQLAALADESLADLPQLLVDRLQIEGQDDDVALLLIRLP